MPAPKPMRLNDIAFHPLRRGIDRNHTSLPTTTGHLHRTLLRTSDAAKTVSKSEDLLLVFVILLFDLPFSRVAVPIPARSGDVLISFHAELESSSSW